MGLFDAFKKKKAAKPDLETPPMPEAAQAPMQPAPGFEEYVPAPQAPSFAPPQEFSPPASQGFSPQAPVSPGFPSPQFAQPQQMAQQNFPLPQSRPQQFQPTPEIPPIGMPQGADIAAQYGEVPEEMPMPTPPEEMAAPSTAAEQVPKVTVFGQVPPQPKFKFYYGPEKTEEVHEAAGQEVPFDVTQELLHLPEMHEETHPEFHPEEEQEKPYKFMPQGQAVSGLRKEAVHLPKQFITVATLYEVGEQLVNMGEDLALAKDTAFRLTDLNELEIEQMVKWHALQQSMEMRIAEIDKLLFKA